MCEFEIVRYELINKVPLYMQKIIQASLQNEVPKQRVLIGRTSHSLFFHCLRNMIFLFFNVLHYLIKLSFNQRLLFIC